MRARIGPACWWWMPGVDVRSSEVVAARGERGAGGA